MPSLRLSALVAGGAGSLLVAATLVALPPARLLSPSTAPTNHVAGAYHVHSVRSDGTGTVDEIAEAAARAGLQFVIITDHGDGARPPQPATYRSGVLCLDAVEISTDDGHYVAIDMPAAPYPLGGEARDVVDDVRRLGGFGVAAHPESEKPELQWRFRDLPVDATEWLNADSQWRDESTPRLLGALLAYPFRPGETLAALLDRPDGSLLQWDELATRRAVVGLAGADAHAGIRWGRAADPYDRPPMIAFPSYEASFRSFSQRLILDAPLSGDAARDAALVYDAVRHGRAYSVIDGFATAGDVEFRATADGRTAAMGGRISTTGPVTIDGRIDGPSTARLIVVGDGIPIYRSDGPDLRVELTGPPAVVRLEAYLPRVPGTPPVPWIVGNPIYLAALGSGRATSGPSKAGLEEATRPLPASGWTAEQASGSSHTLLRDPGASSVGLRFVLGSGAGEAPYVALRHALDPARPIPTHITLRTWADAPRRLSVQLRADGATERRWQRSVYVDATPRVVRIDTRDLRPARDSRESARPERADSLLVVVDTVNERPGTGGTFWIDDVGVATLAAGAQVRTPRSR